MTNEFAGNEIARLEAEVASLQAQLSTAKAEGAEKMRERAALAAEKFADDYKVVNDSPKRRYTDYEVEALLNRYMKGAARLCAEDIRSLPTGEA